MDERLPGRMDDGRRLFDDAAVARRFQRRLREVAPREDGPPRALQYDESGYPIDPRTSLATRVRRLITG
jgi:hypothetical protein